MKDMRLLLLFFLICGTTQLHGQQSDLDRDAEAIIDEHLEKYDQNKKREEETNTILKDIAQKSEDKWQGKQLPEGENKEQLPKHHKKMKKMKKGKKGQKK